MSEPLKEHTLNPEGLLKIASNLKGTQREPASEGFGSNTQRPLEGLAASLES